MSESTKKLIAAIFLLFPFYIVIMHWTIFLIWLKKKIRNEDELVASGLTGVPVVFALAAFVIVPSTTFRNYVAITILLFDPMTWSLLFAIFRWMITCKWA